MEGRREGEERVCKPGHEFQDPSDTAGKCLYNFWKGVSKLSSFAIWSTNLDLQVEMPSGCLEPVNVHISGHRYQNNDIP